MLDLLATVENISEIRDFEINRFVNNCRSLSSVCTRLAEVTDLCQKITLLEDKKYAKVSQILV